jgi:hypothetical protein
MPSYKTSAWGRSVYLALQAGFLAFAADVVLALLHSGVLRSVLVLLTAPFTISAGALILFDVRHAVSSLRRELDVRGHRGFTMQWPDSTWRAGGLGLLVMGLAVLIGGIGGLF